MTAHAHQPLPQRRGACPGLVGADADRRRFAGAAAADRHHPARCLHRLCAAARAARQRRRRSHRARQHPGARLERGIGAALRGGRRRARHRGGGRHSGSSPIRSPDSIPKNFSMPARSPPICAARSAQRSLARKAWRQSLGCDRRRRRARSRRRLPPTCACAPKRTNGDVGASRQRWRRRDERDPISALSRPHDGVEAAMRLLEVMAQRGRACARARHSRGRRASPVPCLLIAIC